MFLPWVRKKLLADPHYLGRWGQRKAELFLKRQCQLRTITRNFSSTGGELDLIMADNSGTIIFVEVKTRRNEDFMPAAAAVNAEKRKNITYTAKYFLKKFDLLKKSIRFDIITVILGDKGKPTIQHYPNAFVA